MNSFVGEVQCNALSRAVGGIFASKKFHILFVKVFTAVRKSNSGRQFVQRQADYFIILIVTVVCNVFVLFDR